MSKMGAVRSILTEIWAFHFTVNSLYIYIYIQGIIYSVKIPFINDKKNFIFFIIPKVIMM